MKVVFSSLFKQDLLDAAAYYGAISAQLGQDFSERAKKTVVRTVIRLERR